MHLRWTTMSQLSHTRPSSESTDPHASHAEFAYVSTRFTRLFLAGVGSKKLGLAVL